MAAAHPVREREQTRTEMLLAEVTREIASRRLAIDAAQDLGEVTISVKLVAGLTRVRGVVWQEERVARIRRD